MAASRFAAQHTVHHKVVRGMYRDDEATDIHHANRPLLRGDRGEAIRPVCAAVRVRAVVQRVYSGVAPEAESPATIPGVLEAVRWRACGGLGR